jgi:hypothetical protein
VNIGSGYVVQPDVNPIPLALALAAAHPASALEVDARRPAPPKTPKGMARCEEPIVPVSRPSRRGEELAYNVEFLGLSVGKAYFTTWERGVLDGEKVTEYRAWFEPDTLVSALADLNVRAYAVVADASQTPVKSLTRYAYRGTQVKESQSRSSGGRKLTSTLERNGKVKTRSRQFPDPAYDYLTTFLLLRRLPAQTSGCAVVYGEQITYTVWIEARGRERIDTVVGERDLERYHLRYASDSSPRIREAIVWVTPGANPVPIRARGPGRTAPTLRLTGYRPGE